MKRDFVDISAPKIALCTDSTDIEKRSVARAANNLKGYVLGGFQPDVSPISGFRTLRSRTAGGSLSRRKSLETRQLRSQNLRVGQI